MTWSENLPFPPVRDELDGAIQAALSSAERFRGLALAYDAHNQKDKSAPLWDAFKARARTLQHLQALERARRCSPAAGRCAAPHGARAGRPCRSRGVPTMNAAPYGRCAWREADFASAYWDRVVVVPCQSSRAHTGLYRAAIAACEENDGA